MVDFQIQIPLPPHRLPLFMRNDASTEKKLRRLRHKFREINREELHAKSSRPKRRRVNGRWRVAPRKGGNADNALVAGHRHAIRKSTLRMSMRTLKVARSFAKIGITASQAVAAMTGFSRALAKVQPIPRYTYPHACAWPEGSFSERNEARP